MRLDVCFDVNRQNETGASGISLASRYGHVRVVELLLAEGAELNFSRSRYGFTPLYGAVVGGHHSLVALLPSRGADASARCKRYYTYGKPSSMDGSAGDRVDEENEVYETLLDIIIRERESMDELKKSSIMSSLLEHGASIEAINSFSETALHTACLLNDPLAVSILLDHNASPGAQDCDGCTPLMYSVFERSPLVIFQLLLEKASIADIVRCDNDGYSVLSRSISYLGCSDPDPTMLLLNTIDSRVARELGTQEGDEFAEFSDILKKIGCDVLINEGRLFEDIIEDVPSQRSMINRLQAIGEHIVMGNVSWCNPDLCDKLRKEGFHTWWTDLTDEEKENGADNDVDADVNDTNSKDDAADKDNVDDDDDDGLGDTSGKEDGHYREFVKYLGSSNKSLSTNRSFNPPSNTHPLDTKRTSYPPNIHTAVPIGDFVDFSSRKCIDDEMESALRVPFQAQRPRIPHHRLLNPRKAFASKNLKQ